MKKLYYIIVAALIIIVIGACGVYVLADSAPFTVSITKPNSMYDLKGYDNYNITITKNVNEILRNVDVWSFVGENHQIIKHYDYWSNQTFEPFLTYFTVEDFYVEIYWEGGYLLYKIDLS